MQGDLTTYVRTLPCCSKLEVRKVVEALPGSLQSAQSKQASFRLQEMCTLLFTALEVSLKIVINTSQSTYTCLD